MAKLISKTYGDALFEIAAEEDKLESHLKEVEAVLGKEKAEDPAEVEALLWKEVDQLNETLPLFKKIKKINVRREDFEKTTGKKIKRFVESNKEK